MKLKYLIFKIVFILLIIACLAICTYVNLADRAAAIGPTQATATSPSLDILDEAVIETSMPLVAGVSAPELPPEPQPITAADWYGVAPEDLDPRLTGLYIPTPEEVVMAAKMTYGESRGIWSLTEQAGDTRTALNRVDSTGYAMGRSLTFVITFDDQFHGYLRGNPTVDDYGRDITWLVKDVITRWLNEKLGFEDVGRVLPPEFKWFEGYKGHNVFRDAYRVKDANTWDWSLPSPYES